MSDGLFKRGEKIHFHGKDSRFEGFFLCYVEKLPMDYEHGGRETHSGEVRCLVQQAGTGIILVKPNPTEDNKGWKHPAPKEGE